ncbi:MAG: phosphotransferase, partial [Gemmatimonadetes bacterium]|nr:phosphotransferase [Gemmatimonadota bacterium]
MPESDNDGNALAADASQVLGVSVQLAGTVASGRNSRVYRVRTTTGEMLAVKRFFRTRSTTRDYLQAEYAALRFLWNHGERRVPRPISVDEPTRLLISEFVAGEPVPTASVSDADIDEAVDFLASLRALTRNPDSADLPDASEACFTLQAIVDNIGARRLRL